MSRSARQWNDHRAHIKLLEGDLNECHRWYGLALVRLKFLLAHQPGSVTDAMVPADGVYIRVDTRPNRVHIVVQDSGIYVESGFLDLLSTGRCSADGYRPANLHYNPAISAYLNSTVTPLQGKVTIAEGNTGLNEHPFTGQTIADGSESQSVGCVTKSAEIVVGPPCDTTYTGGNFCDATLLAKKQTLKKVPSSLFTGKLRLYVQAMYGAKRDDYAASGRGLLLTGDTGSYTINSEGADGSSWLLSLINGGYALVKKNGANLELTPLILTASAQQFANILSAHPRKTEFAFSARLEAYILGYARPDYDPAHKITVAISGPSVVGDPLAYGWHSNWAGDEAHIVMFSADPGTGDRFLSNQYTLTIGQADLGGGSIAFSASISAVASNAAWANWTNSIKIFTYDDTTQQMLAIPKPGAFPPADFNHNAPIYCYTKLDTMLGDCELVTVNAYNNKSAASSYNHDVTVWPSDFQDIAYTDRRTYAGGQTIGETGVKLISPGSTVTLAANVDGQHTANLEKWVFEGPDGWSPQQAGTPYYDGVGPGAWYTSLGWQYIGTQFGLCRKETSPGNYIYAFADWERGRYHKYQAIDNGSATSARVIVEIPLYDCGAVIVGTETTTNHSGAYSEKQSSPGSVGYVHRDARLDEAVVDGVVYVRTGNILDTASAHWTVKLMGLFTYQMPVGNPDLGVTLKSVSAGTIEYDTSISESVGNEPLTQVLANNLVGDSRYFGATLSTPGTGTIDTARTSVQSGAVSNHTLYTQNYGYIYDASIGWA